MRANSTQAGLQPGNNWPTMAMKTLGLATLLMVLLSINYVGTTVSSALLETPIQLVLVAFMDTFVLGYFAIHSRWSGWKEWGAVFAFLYGVSYGLTALESVYLGSLLSVGAVAAILVNGAITSGVFAAALTWSFGRKQTEGYDIRNGRLIMNKKQWVWKVALAGGVFLFLFILFGFAVYYPLAGALDPTAMAHEQSTASSAATLVFPVELIRGALLGLLAVPAIIALPFGWKKTAVVVGLLLAVPVSGDMFLSGAMTPGLQIAHFAEVFGEIMVFGLVFVRILGVRSKTPPLS